MLDKLFSRPLHEHAEPAQRVVGVQALAAGAPQIAQLLRDDPAPEVRAAAAERASDVAALSAALQTEADPAVRTAIVRGLGSAIAADTETAPGHLDAPWCNDAVRAAVADSAHDEALRTRALDAIADESVLADLALTGAHAPTRLAAAERVKSTDLLRKIAEAAQDKDRGVARSARKRVEAVDRRASQATEADAILAQAEALIDQPGPILTAAVDIDRRWKAVGLTDDPQRLARWDAAALALQARFDREHAQQRTHTLFQRRLGEWKEAVRAPSTATLVALREELAALRTLAQENNETAAQADLEQGAQQLAHWEEAQQGLAGAEALVAEAEQLAAGTPIDDAQLPQRWQALELSVRTPALTRRFEAALLVIEQRRLAVVRAAQEQATAAKQQLHTHLHTAEQALTAGQLKDARTALDAARVLKPAAGVLPKPTMQRLSRVTQQLVELERWESFGQHSARLQLCERAEKLIGAALDPAQAAAEVQKLRAEWKELDKQHANVPKSLWERFDGACEKAYAPAARHFAQLAAVRKEARKGREAFIAQAEAHAPTLLAEPRDLRAIAHWLQETDRAWHGSDLGSVDPGAWKKLDAQLKAALAPLRALLAETRGKAKQEREALVAQAKALAEKAGQRDTPSQVKALQAQWKEHAIASPLAPRDERVLWEQFRAACDAVFNTRDSQRKEAATRKREHGRAFEQLCEQMEQLAHDTGEDAEVRKQQRELQTQWKNAATAGETPPPGLDSRFRRARAAVEAMLAGRTRARDAALAQALVQKTQVCEELDALVKNDQPAAAAEPIVARWDALPGLPDAWEKRLRARREAAVRAMADESAWFEYTDRIKAEQDTRAEGLVELEMLLGLDTPADQRPLRLAVQVRQLNSRFKAAVATPGAAEEQLVAWCERPGVGDPRDHQRLERIVGALARPR